MIMMKSFVYYDERYPTSFISDKVGKQIVKFLEEREFEVIDANSLKKILTSYSLNSSGEEAVIVFTRDIVPDLILDNPTSPSVQSPLRKYLDAGHTIIWLGDTPLLYVGYNNGSKQDLPPNTYQKILGLNPSPANVNSKVRRTFYGLLYDLPEWIGTKPHSGVVTGLKFTPLATSVYNNQEVYHGFIISYIRHVHLSGFIRVYDFEMKKPLDRNYMEALYLLSIRSPIGYLMNEIRQLTERLETKFSTIKSEVDCLVKYFKKTNKRSESQE